MPATRLEFFFCGVERREGEKKKGVKERRGHLSRDYAAKRQIKGMFDIVFNFIFLKLNVLFYFQFFEV